MNEDELQTLRRQLQGAIDGHESHITFDAVMKSFPAKFRGTKPKGAPHTAWELLEHMRIAQRDILEFSRNSQHQSPDFPDGYWPGREAPPDPAAWDNSVKAFQRDAHELAQLVAKADLFQPIPHGDGQTLLREVLLVANHNSYELGQIVFLQRMLTAAA